MSDTERRPIAAGNWKMNGLRAAMAEGVRVARGVAQAAGGETPVAEVVICPPATLITSLRGALGDQSMTGDSPVALGGQDCHVDASGAHTGDVSAEMLADAGASYVIVGHSERRADHGETDPHVRAKAEAAHRAGLTAIICVGETEAERDAGRALQVVGEQLQGSVPDAAAASNVVIAYEPVWAIGSGRTPTHDQIAETHGHIRDQLAARFGAEGEAMRVLYGGSVKPANAAEIFALANVDGGLIGGASLKSEDFLAIIEALG